MYRNINLNTFSNGSQLHVCFWISLWTLTSFFFVMLHLRDDRLKTDGSQSNK